MNASRSSIYSTGLGRAKKSLGSATPGTTAVVALLVSVLSGSAQAYESNSEENTGHNTTDSGAEPAVLNSIDQSDGPRGRIELKRDSTSRGTPEETTKTTLRIEGYLDGVVSLLRLDVPFPDQETSFLGSPFNPEIGDIKIRIGFRPFRVTDLPISFFSEVTFPTAASTSVGGGKYQLGPGLQTSLPISLSGVMPASHKMSFAPLIQHVVSVSGDRARENVNYTKLELALKDVWREEYWLKITSKPVVDWQQGAKTGSVLEVEGGVIFSRSWEAWLMIGNRLWGGVVPTTYDTRVQIGIAHKF